MWRFWILAAVLLLSACNRDSMTRQFGVSRDAAPTTIAGAMPPLSTPPGLMSRPDETGLQPQQQSAPPPTPPTGGQAALVEAAGGPAPADIRQQLDANAGVVSLGPAFAQQVMNWAPPPGHVPLGAPARRGWFRWLF